jgi:hypothetical protein
VVHDTLQQQVNWKHEPVAEAIAELTDQPAEDGGITVRVGRVGDPAATTQKPVQTSHVHGILTIGTYLTIRN